MVGKGNNLNSLRKKKDPRPGQFGGSQRPGGEESGGKGKGGGKKEKMGKKDKDPKVLKGKGGGKERAHKERSAFSDPSVPYSFSPALCVRAFMAMKGDVTKVAMILSATEEEVNKCARENGLTEGMEFLPCNFKAKGKGVKGVGTAR